MKFLQYVSPKSSYLPLPPPAIINVVILINFLKPDFTLFFTAYRKMQLLNPIPSVSFTLQKLIEKRFFENPNKNTLRASFTL